MKIKFLPSIYCAIFSSVFFIVSSEPTIGFEVVRDEPRHSIDIWVAATSQVWDRCDRGDNSSNYHDSGSHNDPNDRDRISDHERDMAREGRHESREKNDYTEVSSTAHGSRLNFGPQVRKRISQPGVTFRSDGLFDSSTSLSDWSVTDFCGAIITQNEACYQEFKESALWLSNESGSKIFIKRRFVEDVIRRYSLYENPAFIQVIKTLPFVRESMALLDYDIRCGNFWVAPDDHARKSIRTLHEQFEKDRRYKEQREVLHSYHIPEIIADQTRPSVTDPMYHIIDPKMQQLWDARHDAYEQTRNDPTEIAREYMISAQTRDYLLNHGINPDSLQYCCGNAIQQQFHREYLSIANAFAKIDALGKGEETMLDLMFKLIKEAAEHYYYEIAALASDYCNQALLIADKYLQAFHEYCPVLLQYAVKAAYEVVKTGVVSYAKLVAAVTLGVYDAAKSLGYMAIHPIQTVEDMATGMAHLGIILFKHAVLWQEYLDLYEYYEPDPIKRAERDKKARELRAQIKSDYKTVYETVRESSKGLDEFGIMRKGVAFAVECVVLHKVQVKFSGVVKKTGIAGKIKASAKSFAEDAKALLTNTRPARVAAAIEGATALLEAGGMTAEELALLNAAKAAESAATAAANAGNVAKTAVTTAGEMAEAVTATVAEEAAEVAAKEIVVTGEKAAAEAAAKAVAEEAASKTATAAEKIVRAARTVEDILEECVKKPQNKANFFTKQYQKSGNYQRAMQDFESLCPKDVKPFTKGEVSGLQGKLADGRNVSVRTGSSGENLPTLQIQEAKIKIKIRYA